jgi:hypothetical protein
VSIQRRLSNAVSAASWAALLICAPTLSFAQPIGPAPNGRMPPSAIPSGGLPLIGTPPTNLPERPTAVALPSFERVSGPGPMFDSSPAQWPGHDMAHYGYVANEYFVTGTAGGEAYTTRVVIRQPADSSRFSGLVVAEAMHPVGAAHAFEYNSVYIMDSGHIAVEIATAGVQQFAAFNAERYRSIDVGPDQGSEVLAQVGALVRNGRGPLGALAVRKMVLWGTSASSAILTNYLPAHAVWRTPDMQRIYDGFLPTSNGSTIAPVDVPMIQVPTQHEYENIATAQQDSDEPGQQYRSYEFAGLGHLDSRNNVRLEQSDCVQPLSRFPSEAYVAVALHHLFQWVDAGVPPPMADRVLIDRNRRNDGSLMMLDANGNPQGGIRSPYVDVPIAAYTAHNTSVTQSVPAAPAQRGFGPGIDMTALLCTLSAYQTPFTQPQLRRLYGSKRSYVRAFERRLNELERAGWSLPVYHDLIMADARAVQF